ncbi:MAG TPA: transketolase [Candidatus Brocadiia bacterium]|nr:transketolase [Candidatus Brocadiia bacterium]
MSAEAQTCPALDAKELDRLRGLCRQARIDLLRSIANAGAGHTGGAMSLVEIVTALYFRVMRVDPARPDWPERDRFILSKGHSSPGLYAALAARGYFPKERLSEFDVAGGMLQGHPDMLKTPGIDMSTGSLGQGLSVGIGMALAGRLKGLNVRVFVLAGDGEMQEGQVWEAAMYAGFHKVSRLVLIVDCNSIQLTGRTDETLSLAPLAGKLEAFGWRCVECDGHDLADLVPALERAVAVEDGPVCVIARTEKGHGVSFIANRVEWHAKAPTPEQLAQAIAELEGAK